MAFHTSKRDLKLPQLYIDNTVVEYVDQFSLLGIMIDRQTDRNSLLTCVNYTPSPEWAYKSNINRVQFHFRHI